MRIWPFSEINELRRTRATLLEQLGRSDRTNDQLREKLVQQAALIGRMQAELTVRNAEQTILTAPVRDVLNYADDKQRAYMVGQIIQQAAARARRT